MGVRSAWTAACRRALVANMLIIVKMWVRILSGGGEAGSWVAGLWVI